MQSGALERSLFRFISTLSEITKKKRLTMKASALIGMICSVKAEINLAEKLSRFNFQDCVAEVSKQTAC